MFKILIDTDLGVDDTVALVLALRSPEIDVVGITTIFGDMDVDVESCTENVLKILDLVGTQKIPVSQGASMTLLGKKTKEPRVSYHGVGRLGGVNLPAPKRRKDPRKATDLILDLVTEYDNDLIIATLAPLTNIAEAILIDPKTMNRVKRIVSMAGAIAAPGNVTAVASANMFNDPEAAKVVFESGIPITMFPLDVTMKALVTPEFDRRLVEADSEVAIFLRKITRHYRKMYLENDKLPGNPISDACPIASIVRPNLFSTQKIRVDIETSGICRGQTVGDLRKRSTAKPNVTVALEVNSHELMTLIFDRVL